MTESTHTELCAVCALIIDTKTGRACVVGETSIAEGGRSTIIRIVAAVVNATPRVTRGGVGAVGAVVTGLPAIFRIYTLT